MCGGIGAVECYCEEVQGTEGLYGGGICGVLADVYCVFATGEFLSWIYPLRQFAEIRTAFREFLLDGTAIGLLSDGDRARI